MTSTPLTPELACSDITISLTFYTQVLGFAVDYQRPEDGFAMLERQGARLMLDRLRQNPGSSGTGTDRNWLTAKLERPFGRGINLQIETTQVDTLYAAVQHAGAPVFLPIEDTWYRRGQVYLGNRQFIVQDPDGYLLRFFESLGVRNTP
jgi:catechol 2,3-dioxygenase-like lactoylglutathione lyase family enzyme